MGTFSENLKNVDKTIVDRSGKDSETVKTIKKFRNALNSGSVVEIEFELELLQHFAKSFQNASPAILMMVSVVAISAIEWAGLIQPIIWGVLTSLSYVFNYQIIKKFLKKSHPVDLRKWKQTFFWTQLLIAVPWMGYALMVPIDRSETTMAILQFSTVLMFQASTTMLTQGSARSVLIICGPLTAIIGYQFLMPYSTAGLLMTVITWGSLTFFYLLANRLKFSLVDGFRQRAKNETLIAELETARSISDEARRRAEEANLAKSRFLATMSHELRTPLNAILGFSEIMKKEVLGEIDNPQYKEYISDIHNSGDHLLKLINEILDLSRIEAGRMELNEKAISLLDAAQEARSMNQLKARGKSISITLTAQKNLPQILGDERAVRQICLNLLSNAVKFTPKGGQIDIKVGWTQSGGQYISVTDNGPGIPEEEIPIVLSSFGQGSIAIKSAEQGTGLGLPIVQSLMQQHGGRLDFQSKLRKGTKATVIFPRNRVLEVMGAQATASDIQTKKLAQAN